MAKTKFQQLLDDSGIKRQVIAERMGLTRSGFYRKQQKPKERLLTCSIVYSTIYVMEYFN